jgi:hypothetical protein
MEERIYERCVDAKLLQNPATYCQRFLLSGLNLTLWTNATNYKNCDDAADALAQRCTNSDNNQECFPCAFEISFIFSKYDRFLTSTLEGVF